MNRLTSIGMLAHFLLYDMKLIDWFILIVLGIGAYQGFMKGFINQLAAIAGFIVGLIAAKMLYASLAERLCPTLTESMTLAQIISFMAIWIVVPVLFGMVGMFLTKTMDVILLGWVNKSLGAALGLLKNLILLMLLISILEFIDTSNHLISQTKKAESVLYYPIRNVAGVFFPVAKQVSQQYIFK